MNIISYNLNGLNAAIKNGVMEFIIGTKADIYCFQETKVQNSRLGYHFKKYYQYWNFSRIKGQSETLVLSRYPALKATYHTDSDFNCEGRIITLEYETFYLINVYVPSPEYNESRKNFRHEWNQYFENYLYSLHDKPLIICGDWNVSLEDSSNPYLDDIASDFNCLLNSDLNLIDVYKYMHGNSKGYTWTHPTTRFNLDCGKRLDYFIISKHLYKYTTNCNVYTNIHFSDHYPISMFINLSFTQSLHRSEKKLTDEWQNINWAEEESNLFNLQCALANATMQKNW